MIEGLRIVKVRKMTPAEMRKEGWVGERPAVLVLEDGQILYPSKDPEGNGPGYLFGRDSGGPTIITG